MKKIFTLLAAFALVSSFYSNAAVTADPSELSTESVSELSRSQTKECVNAYTTDTYTVTFKGGEEATVLVSGDGDTDLDLYIYDENGNLIESDTDSLDTMLCSWTPKWTGKFKIKIKNLGSVKNYYTMWIY